jgi:hypothetical protein
MERLLGGSFDPITTEFGFVEASLDTVTSWWVAREAGWGRDRGVSASAVDVRGTLADNLQRLLPLTSVECRRYLMLATGGAWTAVFDNGWQGSDAAGLSLTARELGCRAIRVVTTPAAALYGARMFELYGPRQTAFLNYQRTISVANDGGRWRVGRSGEPLDGEDPIWFEARKTRDRFRDEHLAALLLTLGIDVFNEAFYGPDGKLVEKRGPAVKGSVEYDLAAAQAWQAGSTPGRS